MQKIGTRNDFADDEDVDFPEAEVLAWCLLLARLLSYDAISSSRRRLAAALHESGLVPGLLDRHVPLLPLDDIAASNGRKVKILVLPCIFSAFCFGV